jgi:hypothetical protein
VVNKLDSDNHRKLGTIRGDYQSFSRGNAAADGRIILTRFIPFSEVENTKSNTSRSTIHQKNQNKKATRQRGRPFLQGRIVPTEGKFRQNFLAKSYEPKNRGVK